MNFLCILIAEIFRLKPEGLIEKTKTKKKKSYELSLIALRNLSFETLF